MSNSLVFISPTWFAESETKVLTQLEDASLYGITDKGTKIDLVISLILFITIHCYDLDHLVS